MLGRLILILVQLAAGWFAGPIIAQNVPKFGTLDIFIMAVIFAIFVWLLGILGAVVLNGVAQPSSATLTYALVVALIGAGLTLVPQVKSVIAAVIPGVPDRAYPLIGAVIGYAIKK